MATIIHCDSCSCQQPKDYEVGDLCVECGGSVRVDVRCGWCTELTPATGNFCKHCGSKSIEEQYFGAARILKSLGFSQEEIPLKIAALPEAKLQQYQDEFYRHYRVIQYAKDQLLSLSSALYMPIGQAIMLVERELLPKIPFEDSELANYEQLIKRPINLTTCLEVSESLHPVIPFLAEVVKMKEIPFTSSHYPDIRMHWANQLTVSDFPIVQTEVLLCLAHPNTYHQNLDWTETFELVEKLLMGKDVVDYYTNLLSAANAIPHLQPYVAHVLYRLRLHFTKENEQETKRLHEVVNAQGMHRDKAFALANAMLLGQEAIISQISTQKIPEAYIAYYHLLYFVEPAIAKRSLTRAALSVFQLNALLDFTETYDKQYAQENKGELPEYEEAVHLGATLLLEKFQSNFIYDKPINKIPEADWLRYARFIGRFSETQKHEDYQPFIDALIQLEKQNVLSMLLTHQPNGLKFNDALEQQLYKFTNEFDKTDTGFAKIASWEPMIQQEYWPSLKTVLKIIEFLKANYTSFSGGALQETQKQAVQEALLKLINSPQKSAMYVSRFLVSLSLENSGEEETWLSNQALKNRIFSNSYSVGDDFSDTAKSRTFAADDEFIKHFFGGDWYLFIQKLHQALSVAQGYGTTPYDLMETWIDRSPTHIAKQYQENPTWASETLAILLESILVLNQGEELLGLQTEEGNYPLLEVLAAKEWGYQEAYLFTQRPPNLPVSITYKLYKKLTAWFSVDVVEKLNTELYRELLTDSLQFSTSAYLPDCMLPLWFKYGNTLKYKEYVTQAFQKIFNVLLADINARKLPVVLTANGVKQLSGIEVLNSVFPDTLSCLNWLADTAEIQTITEPLNQFMIFVLHDMREEILPYVNKAEHTTAYSAFSEEQFLARNHKIIFDFIEKMMVTAKELSRGEQEIYLRLLLDITVACHSDNHAGDVLSILSNMGDLYDETNERYEALLSVTLPEKETYGWGDFKFAYSYIEDYYYSFRRKERWVGDFLIDFTPKVIDFFNSNDSYPGQITYAINKLVEILVKENEFDDVPYELRTTFRTITSHLKDILTKVDPAQFDGEEIAILYKDIQDQYEQGASFGFVSIRSAVEEIFLYHFPDIEEEEDDELDEEYQTVEAYEENQTSAEIPTGNVLSTEEITGLLTSFRVDEDHIKLIQNHLEDYKATQLDNPMLLSPLTMRMEEVKAWFTTNPVASMDFYQKLYMLVLDPETAPDAKFPSLGAMARMVFVQLTQDTVYAAAYASGIQGMVSSGVYSEIFTAVLNDTVNQLNN
ncbi:MAG: zinc ribbon domain-containing protein [Mesonia hippocampi]|uniref:zinc ribbon domain-containing protein n=1 Tax=Mesonia hippocampi TaxID=1628250 RepID=UPI003F9E33C1